MSAAIAAQDLESQTDVMPQRRPDGLWDHLSKRPQLEEVPLEFLKREVCGRSRWKRIVHSMPQLEAEAMLFGLRHFLRATRNIGKRLLLLSDSMTVVLSSTKGRSSSKSLCMIR